MTRMFCTLALLATPALAQAGVVGGGLVLSDAPLERLGAHGLHIGGMDCIGGVGFVADEGWRRGGEGNLCGGPQSLMAYGGMQLGWQSRAWTVYGAAYSGLGAGWLHASDFDGRDRHQVGFLYARPTVALGVPFGFGSVEIGLYGMVPVPLLQVVRGDRSAVASFPHVGSQISILFGDFRPKPKRPEPAPAPPPPRAEPKPPPPSHPPPPPPPRAEQKDEKEDERPLAIPADQWPPR